jgi:hypothetical protein
MINFEGGATAYPLDQYETFLSIAVNRTTMLLRGGFSNSNGSSKNYAFTNNLIEKPPSLLMVLIYKMLNFIAVLF